MSVARFLEPFGRPRLLPVSPFLNCVCLGGLPRPTFRPALLTFLDVTRFAVLAMAFLSRYRTLCIQFLEFQPGLDVNSLKAVRVFKSPNNCIGIVGIEFDS